MNNSFLALYVGYLAIAGSLLYVAWQGTETGSVGKPCLDAIVKVGELAGDPVATQVAEQDQNQKCEHMMKYDMAVGHMLRVSN